MGSSYPPGPQAQAPRGYDQYAQGPHMGAAGPGQARGDYGGQYPHGQGQGQGQSQGQGQGQGMHGHPHHGQYGYEPYATNVGHSGGGSAYFPPSQSGSGHHSSHNPHHGGPHGGSHGPPHRGGVPGGISTSLPNGPVGGALPGGPVTLPRVITNIHDALLKMNDLIRSRGGKLSSRECAQAMRAYDEPAAAVIERKVREYRSLTAMIQDHPLSGIDRDSKSTPFNFVIDMGDHRTTTFLGGGQGGGGGGGYHGSHSHQGGGGYSGGPSMGSGGGGERGGGGGGGGGGYYDHQQQPAPYGHGLSAVGAGVPGATAAVGAPVRFLPFGNHPTARGPGAMGPGGAPGMPLMGGPGTNRYGPGPDMPGMSGGRERSRSRERDRGPRGIRDDSRGRSRSPDRGGPGGDRSMRGRRGRGASERYLGANSGAMGGPPGMQGQGRAGPARLLDEASKVRGPCPDWGKGTWAAGERGGQGGERLDGGSPRRCAASIISIFHHFPLLPKQLTPLCLSLSIFSPLSTLLSLLSVSIAHTQHTQHTTLTRRFLPLGPPLQHAAPARAPRAPAAHGGAAGLSYRHAR